MKLSICIPTYNRAHLLANCLNSIIQNKRKGHFPIEVCVSDNASTDETPKIIQAAQKQIKIHAHRNNENIGMARNIVRASCLGTGDFLWILGDDDLLTVGSIEKVLELIDANPEVDFFYLNSGHLDKSFVDNSPSPFDIALLPPEMERFSKANFAGELNFWDLIDPKISFDFLGGIYLAVFRRSQWLKHLNVLSEEVLHDSRPFSGLDNTFPHAKVYATAFRNSKAYFSPRLYTANLSGARDWSPLYPMVKTIRLADVLKNYRKAGLPMLQYWRCRNANLYSFATDMFYIMSNPQKSGRKYLNLPKIWFSNLLYPGFYSSFFIAIFKAIRKLMTMFIK